MAEMEKNAKEARLTARSYFLTEENLYGCAETTLMVLQEAFGLPNATDCSPAMALNGGVAWSGGICGALTGAAIAVGRLAAYRVDDHRAAKRIARRIVTHLMGAFQSDYGAINCKDLIRYDIATSEGYKAFIESGVWRDTCMRQIEFTILQLISLADRRVWEKAVRELERI